MRSPSTSTPRAILHAVVGVLIVLAAVALWRAGRDAARPPTSPAVPSPSPSPLAASVAPAATSVAPPVATAPSPKATTFESFQRRPFAVARSSGAHEWTKEDGRDPDVILEIAHNDTEVQRLMKENDRIRRRQLVYRKEPAFKLVQQAKATGEPVRTLMLPGLDGQELEMAVDRADLSSSGLSGTFTGHLPGRGQSLVTLAFKEGREAFTVLSPDDGTYLQGHPREPGEIIVTSFHPDEYQALPGGDPIKPTK